MNLIFFRLIEVSTKKGRKTASMRVAINRKNIRFISYHLIFIASQDSKHSYKPIINDGLF